MNRCINCNIALNRCNTIGNKVLDNDDILTVFRHWSASQPVNSTDRVCQACWKLAKNVVSGRQSIDEPRLGHLNICLHCSRSLSAQRVVHQLNTESTREARIYNVIQEWILPRTVLTTSRICHACWVSADRASAHMTLRPSTSSESNRLEELIPEAPTVISIKEDPRSGSNQHLPTIFLPDYMRAIETESRCFIEGCTRTERYRVPLATRKMLLAQYNYYVPVNNRLCDQHLVIKSWNFLDSLKNNYVKEFTAKHIQEMLALKD